MSPSATVDIVITRRRWLLCSGRIVTAEQLDREPYGSHVLGELCYLKDEGERVTGLALYNHAWDLGFREQVKAQFPRVLVKIIGDARAITCSVCSKSIRWEIGEAGLRALLKRKASTPSETWETRT